MSDTQQIEAIDAWTASEEILEEVLDRLSDEEFLGLVAVGPEVVDLSHRKTLPLLGFRGCTLADEMRRPFVSMAILTAVRLESNQVFVDLACRPKPLSPAPPGPPPVPKDGTTHSRFAIEVRERLPDLPWRAGTLLTTVLLGDQQSNRIHTRLIAGSGEPEVEAFLDARRRPAYPSPVVPAAGETWPSYRREPESPSIPEEVGIALSVERVAVVGPEHNAVLRGSFRLSAIPREIVRPEPEEEDSGWREVGDPEATAVIPITVLIVGSEESGPAVLRLQVPSYDAVDAAAERNEVTGHFNLDLLSLPGTPGLAQRYSIWALSGEALGGPAPLSFVTEDMLPLPGD